jgi:hypothetical protein
VPAPTSSRIPIVAKLPVALAPDQCRSLLGDLAQITDPRQRRGRRHALAAVLAVAAAAVLAGATSLAAIGEWAADAPGPVLAALGVRRDPLRRVWRPPTEATVRRVLARVDPDALELVIGRWLADQQRPPPQPAWRQAVAVDGKILRGSGHHHAAPVHLLAALPCTRSPSPTPPATAATAAPSSAACRSPRSLAWISPRHPGDPHHPQCPLPPQPAVAHRHGLRHHQPHRRPGTPCPPGRLDPRALGHRERPALDPGCDLRRGQLPGPQRHRPTSDGQPAQPRHRHPSAAGSPQHRRRAAMQRPRRHPSLALLGITSS